MSVQSKSTVLVLLVHAANVFRLAFTTTKLQMTFLGSIALRTSKFATIKHKAITHSCDMLGLS